MKTEPIYLTKPYEKTVEAVVTDVIDYGNNRFGIILDQTVFYPVGGGQPTDQGTLNYQDETLKVTEVVIKDGEINHFVQTENPPQVGDRVIGEIDWARRNKNMAIHTAGHVIDFALQKLGEVPENLTPLKADHGSKPFILYKGTFNSTIKETLQNEVNKIVSEGIEFSWEYKSLEELERVAKYLQPGLPNNKPLRALTLEGYGTVADGGTIMANANEIEFIEITEIKEGNGEIELHYNTAPRAKSSERSVKVTRDVEERIMNKEAQSTSQAAQQIIRNIVQIYENAKAEIGTASTSEHLNEAEIKYLGRKAEFNNILKSLGTLQKEDRGAVGQLANKTKNEITELIENKKSELASKSSSADSLDITAPGKKIEPGSLHLTVTHAIREIEDIFKRIGFYRVRYPEVEWDYYAFTALNFPDDHPARDNWETFFIDNKEVDKKYGYRILTPHTSSGQVREMETGRMPIRMINISRCSRRQLDASHTMQFFQFEGLMIDKNVTIAHLKGVLDYFVKEFFGPNREVRIRPYDFLFTEPSFEVDISCGNCGGTGCKLCKQGWLEIGGSGMVHPNVLRAGGIDPDVYSGWAFGWGVERNKVMQKGINIDDIRILYQNDIRFLKQF